MCNPVLCELLVKLRERVGFEAMFGTGEEGFARVCADEAIPSDGFRSGCGFEQEGLLRGRAERV